MEGLGKILDQETAKDVLKKLGKEYKPAGQNVTAVAVGGDFLFQTTNGDVIQGSAGDVIFLTDSGVETMDKDTFNANYQKA